MPCAQRSWLAHLSLVVAKLLSFWALCHGRDPQPGPVRFPDRRQEHFIKALPEYHVVHPVRVDARGHFLSYGLHHPGAGGRRKRDLADSADQVYYRIWHEEKDLFFNLTVNRGFLSNSYIVEKRYGNLSHVKMAAPVGPHCHLQGTVLQQGTTVGTAALSACHGLVHYALYDATYETKESKKEDLVFIFWAPECVPLKSKMIYTSSKDAIKKKLTGIKHELQANCYEEVKDCCTLVEKLGGSADISLEGKPL